MQSGNRARDCKPALQLMADNGHTFHTCTVNGYTRTVNITALHCALIKLTRLINSSDFCVVLISTICL